MVNRLPEGWNNNNLENFTKWIDDNKSKSDQGCEAMKAVMKMGSDIASAAAVQWFRDKGKMKQDEVAALSDEIVKRIVEQCSDRQENVIRDCASLFAGTGNAGMVMMMAFVSYSLIGVHVAESLMAGRS